ncbi:MAG: Cysteine desulfurase IscS [Planctomycetes bacterium]|nr:Cysteine desulfurase IscS [Planctomycetota bacterium]
MRPIYLDHNATTPLSAEARAAMEPFLSGQFGNPLTSHRFGEGPRGAVEAARREVLALVGDAQGATYDVVFDSGGTEALNHVVKGLAFRSLEGGRAGARRKIVIGGAEHYGVAGPARWLGERFGFDVVEVMPGRDGVCPVEGFVEHLDGSTLLCALMWAQNEVGSLQPVREVGRFCRAQGVPFVVDTVQCPGKVDLSGAPEFADALAFSAHKLYGPKGVGALLLRKGLEPDILVHGASQESGRRGGTHNVAGIAGFGAAAHHARTGLAAEAARLASMRDQLWQEISRRIEGAHWNGAGAPMLPNTLNVSFDGCPSSLLAEETDRRGVAISQGAACRSGAVTPSHTLSAMGLPHSRSTTSVRVSFGHANDAHDAHAAADAFAESVKAVRARV